MNSLLRSSFLRNRKYLDELINIVFCQEELELGSECDQIIQLDDYDKIEMAECEKTYEINACTYKLSIDEEDLCLYITDLKHMLTEEATVILARMSDLTVLSTHSIFDNFDFLDTMTNLTELRINNVNFKSSYVKYISKMNYLAKIELSTIKLDPTDLQYLPSSLSELKLSYVSLTTIDHLPILPHLKSISLENNPISNISKLYDNRYKNLEEVCVQGTDVENIDVRKIPKLKRINIAYCPARVSGKSRNLIIKRGPSTQCNVM